jgi:putative ABC transport system permease protein
MNLYSLSWMKIIRKPLGSLLAILLITISVCLILTVHKTSSALDSSFEKNLKGIDLVLAAKGSPLQAVLCNVYHIDFPTGNIPYDKVAPFLNPKHPLIEKAVPLSIGDNYMGYRIVGTNENILSFYSSKVKTGRFFQKPMEVVVGAECAEKLALKEGASFSGGHGLVGDMGHEGHSFKVVGILEFSGNVLDKLILTSLNSYSLMHAEEKHHESEDHSDHDHSGHEHDHSHEHNQEGVEINEHSLPDEITSVLIRFKGKGIQSLNMHRSINSDNLYLQAASPSIEMSRLSLLMGTGEKALNVLGWFILLFSGISILISMLLEFNKRRQELALLRTMGVTRMGVFLQLTLEGFYLGILGFLFGWILSYIIKYPIQRIMEKGYQTTLEWENFSVFDLYIAIATLGLAFLATIWPSIKAYKISNTETLSKTS